MYICRECGAKSPKWAGKCPNCQAWNTLEEFSDASKKSSRISPGKLLQTEKIALSSEGTLLSEKLVSSSSELDSVLGGGLSRGSLVLLSGEPGIGKSTLALQMSEWYGTREQKVLYISGEEHVGQIQFRAKRLSVKSENIELLSDADFDSIYMTMTESGASVIIIDSLSVLSSPSLEGAPGSISQIRLMTEMCMMLAKKTQKSIILIGHVTKDGSISGPKSLEHLVDVVLFLEGMRSENYRILRAFKNRFGSTENVGLFRMESGGLMDLTNPGMEFISPEYETLVGSALTLALEGTRPLLIEIESLTTYTKFGYPKRSARGMSQGKLELLLAVLTKFTQIKLDNSDVYTNIGRGLHITEPGIDLASIAALISGKKEKPLGKKLWFGEVSLTGVIKPIYLLDKRLKEAEKLGFTHVVIPENYEGSIPKGLDAERVKTLKDVVKLFE